MAQSRLATTEVHLDYIRKRKLDLGLEYDILSEIEKQATKKPRRDVNIQRPNRVVNPIPDKVWTALNFGQSELLQQLEHDRLAFPVSNNNGTTTEDQLLALLTAENSYTGNSTRYKFYCPTKCAIILVSNANAASTWEHHSTAIECIDSTASSSSTYSEGATESNERSCESTKSTKSGPNAAYTIGQ